MARGPKPAPAGVVEQKAPVRSRHRQPITAPATPAQVVEMPEDLSAEAAAIWQRLAPTLAQAKLLTPVDALTFGRYCRNFAKWAKMQLKLDTDSETYVVETASGKVHRARPEFLIADRLEQRLVAAEDRFGLNPAERQRIMVARAQTGITGDLFGAANPVRQDGLDPSQPPAPEQRPQSPLGLLN